MRILFAFVMLFASLLIASSSGTFSSGGGGGTAVTAGTNISVAGSQVSTINNPTFSTSVTSPAYISSSANPATAGLIESANGDSWCFRNSANNANACLTDPSDVLTWPNSISISGNSTQQFLAPTSSGSNGPTYSFVGQTNYGMGMDTVANSLYLRANGTTYLQLNAGGGVSMSNGGTFTFFGSDLVRPGNIGTNNIPAPSLYATIIGLSGGAGLGGSLLMGGGSLANAVSFMTTGYQRIENPATGSTVAIQDGINSVIIHNPGTLTSLTVTMPSKPSDGQTLGFSCFNTVTTLTVNPNAGQSVRSSTPTCSATVSAKYIYSAADTAWYICN